LFGSRLIPRLAGRRRHRGRPTWHPARHNPGSAALGTLRPARADRD